jgi:uncharacterized membrane protein YhaH (DUF805 family)
MQWYIEVLKKYVAFSGRARRKEYWMFTLFNVIVSIVLAILDAVLSTSPLLGGVYALAVFLPSLGVAVRRLHDTGRSGWFLLLGLIPFVGFIILLVFLVGEGKAEDNKWGSNPKLAHAH